MISLESLAAELEAVKARIVAIETKTTERVAKQTASEKRVADDEDLDGQYGDPVIRYGLKPKYWTQQPDENVGKRFSECSAEYLDATAKYLAACEYMATKNGEDTKARYKERDAARARGWAQRKRNGWLPPATAEEAEGFADVEPSRSRNQPADFDVEAWAGSGEDDIPFVTNMTTHGSWWSP